MKHYVSTCLFLLLSLTLVRAGDRLLDTRGDLVTGRWTGLNQEALSILPRWSGDEISRPVSDLLFLRRNRAPVLSREDLPAWRLEFRNGDRIYAHHLEIGEHVFRTGVVEGETVDIPRGMVDGVHPVPEGSRYYMDHAPGRQYWQQIARHQLASATDTARGFISQRTGAWGIGVEGWPDRFHLFMEAEGNPQRLLLLFQFLGTRSEGNDDQALQLQLQHQNISFRARAPHPQRPELMMQQQIWNERLQRGLRGRVQVDVYGDISTSRFFLFVDGEFVKEWVYKLPKSSESVDTRWFSFHHMLNEPIHLRDLRVSTWNGRLPPHSRPEASPEWDRLVLNSGDILSGRVIGLNGQAWVLEDSDGRAQPIPRNRVQRMLPLKTPMPEEKIQIVRVLFGDRGEQVPLQHPSLRDGILSGTLAGTAAEFSIPREAIRLLEFSAP